MYMACSPMYVIDVIRKEVLCFTRVQYCTVLYCIVGTTVGGGRGLQKKNQLKIK